MDYATGQMWMENGEFTGWRGVEGWKEGTQGRAKHGSGNNLAWIIGLIRAAAPCLRWEGQDYVFLVLYSKPGIILGFWAQKNNESTFFSRVEMKGGSPTVVERLLRYTTALSFQPLQSLTCCNFLWNLRLQNWCISNGSVFCSVQLMFDCVVVANGNHEIIWNYEQKQAWNVDQLISYQRSL